MSITETTRRAGPYATDGSQVEFPFAFKVFKAEDVVVTRSENGLDTDLTLTTDYTVNLNPNQDAAPGGEVVLTSAPDGPTITITSGMAATQPTVFTNAGGFFPRVLNDSLDRVTILIQQLMERVSRVPLLPLGDAPVGQFPVVLPNGKFGWSTGSGTDSGLRADLGTAAPGKGAELVGLTKRDPTASTLDVANWIKAQATNAREFGVVGDGVTDNTASLPGAINYARTNGNRLVLPAGEILLSDDVVIDGIPSAQSGRRETFTMSGQGSGSDGSFLHFSNGSLKVHAVHQLSDFRVASDTSDGIVIAPSDPPIGYPARSGMSNVHASYCAGSGIVISANWIYLMHDVYARYNKGWGLEGRALGVAPYENLACNSWSIIGGEFQGNGTRQGTLIGSLGGSERGTGGGLFLGQSVQVNIVGASIEGNVGDGLKLGEQSRGVAVIGVYFEKNGSHHENRDICNDQPGNSVNGPNSIYILNSQFTPQDYNGTTQERAIELWDCVDLRITNPQFFTSSGNGYSLPPIAVREGTAGRASGWVEGRYYTSIGAYPQLLTNDTRRFGFPRVQQFSPDLVLPPAVQTDSQRYYVDMPSHCGKQVDIDYDVRPVAGSGNSVGQVARIQTRIARGPAGTTSSAPSTDHTLMAGNPSMRGRVTTFHDDYPGGSVEVIMRRDGTHANDTAAGDVNLIGVRVTTYAGLISALEKA